MLLFSLSQKSVTRGPPGLLRSSVMSIFPITSHQYTITLYTTGHLQISWDVFAKKSADIMSFRNSFITFSTFFIIKVKLSNTWAMDWNPLCSSIFILTNYSFTILFWKSDLLTDTPFYFTLDLLAPDPFRIMLSKGGSLCKLWNCDY